MFVSFLIELDMEGTISPEDDPPQEMGDPSKEVTEDMRDNAQEERTQGSMAMADGKANDCYCVTRYVFDYVCLR